MRKHKPQKFGLNPEWVKIYILQPLSIIIAVAVIMIIALNKYNAYAHEKAEKESIAEIERAEREVRLITEQEYQREQEQIREERERQKESIAKVEVERRKTNTLYEDQITKKVIEGKKYWRNNELKKVGKVESIYGLDVITNNDWQFTLDTNGNIPSEVVNIGYNEYIKELKKQKEQAEKTKKTDQATLYKINQIYEQERAEQKKLVEQHFGNKKYIYLKFEGKKYLVKEIDGRTLKMQEQKTKEKILIDAYDKRLQVITPREYLVIEE